ncbi:type II toxin-antitoxin system Phd/YefM family antitoxin [Sulfurimonas sediminis]|nr:type II toxin-antitoxin system Phd/YefM family antitoxin [Sulfurimonas sediminis]
MHTISATEIKQNSTRLQEALRDDILITKRDKPFVVVMDYEKYIKLKTIENKWNNNKESDLAKEAKRIKKSAFTEHALLDATLSDGLDDV